MRTFAFAAFLTLALPAAHSATPLACEGRRTGAGTGELVCVVPAAAREQSLRFTARFSGVHDDSQAGVAATLDGQRIDCAAGGKPHIQGEGDGDMLLCDLALAPSAGAARTLKLHLLWFHAEPAALDVVRD